LTNLSAIDVVEQLHEHECAKDVSVNPKFHLSSPVRCTFFSQCWV
jgi:hypothetical protein